MIDLARGETTGGGRFELTMGRHKRQVRLVAEAADATTLLTAAITGFIAAVHALSGSGNQRSSARSVSIRAEASTTAELFTGLVSATVDRIESFEIEVSAVRLDGLVRSESGQIAWGRLEIADASIPTWLPLSIASGPNVHEFSGYLRLEVVLQQE